MTDTSTIDSADLEAPHAELGAADRSTPATESQPLVSTPATVADTRDARAATEQPPAGNPGGREGSDPGPLLLVCSALAALAGATFLRRLGSDIFVLATGLFAAGGYRLIRRTRA